MDNRDRAYEMRMCRANSAEHYFCGHENELHLQKKFGEFRGNSASFLDTIEAVSVT